MKRQAMDEVQKAVAEAEQKAFEMIAAERAKMEKTLSEAKRKAQEDAILVINEQEDSSEVKQEMYTTQRLINKERKVLENTSCGKTHRSQCAGGATRQQITFWLLLLLVFFFHFDSFLSPVNCCAHII